MTILAGNIPIYNVRYYKVPAAKKSIECCASHGADHAAYGWGRKIDPTWSQEQVDAYVSAYAKQVKG